MANRSILKGLQIALDIPYRDPDAIFSLVGVDGGNKNAFLPIGEAMLSRHVLALGAPASGKSNLLYHMLRNLRANLTDQDVLFVLDPCGEYYERFYQTGDIVIADDERASDENGEACWNLFLELNQPSRLVEDASALVDTLFADFIARSAEPYYPTAARDLMTALIVYIVRQGDVALQTNQALRELIDGFDVESMRAILESDVELRGMTAYLNHPDSAETLGVIAALQQAGRELLQGRFRGDGTLGVRRLVEGKGARVVFLCYDAQRGAMLRPVYGAFVDLILQATLARSDQEGNVYLFLDELRVLPRLRYLEDALLLGRSKGLRLLCCMGSVNQLRHTYGETAAQSLLSAFGTTALFRLHDRESREFAKNLYGRHRVVETFTSSVQVRGVVEQVMDQFIIEDEDLTAMPTGRAVICSLHYPPFWFSIKRYDQ